MTYRTVRYYQNLLRKDILEEGLTQEEAQAHCRSRETSSDTCRSKESIERTAQLGPWFDGYEKENDK